MNMLEASRIILGLRAVGWDDKSINDLFLWNKNWRRTIQIQREKGIDVPPRESGDSYYTLDKHPLSLAVEGVFVDMALRINRRPLPRPCRRR